MEVKETKFIEGADAKKVPETSENKAAPSENIKDVETTETLHWIKRFIKNITVEPLISCYLFSSAIVSLAVQQLYLEKACRLSLGYGNEICTAIITGNGTNLIDYETDIQEVVAVVNAWKNPLATFLPALLLLFIGSWSDRRGRRKPCMLVPLLGDCLSCVALLVSSYMMDSMSINVTAIIEALCTCLSGGVSVMLMGTFSYIGDITSEEQRTVRVGIVSAVVTLCYLVGFGISGVLYEAIGYYGVFWMAIILYVIGILYGFFRLKEHKINVEPRTTNFCVDFFNPLNCLDTIKVTFKKRENYGRLRIILLLIVSVFASGPGVGEAQLNYLYTRVRFEWGPVDFTIFSSYDTIIHLVGTAIVLGIFSHYFGMTDPLIAIVACCATVISSLWYGFAKSGFFFYWGPAVGIFSTTKAIAIRSMETKLVPDIDRGKVQSVFGVIESLMIAAISPLYNLVYEATIKTVPGTIYFMSVGLIIVAILIFIWIYIVQKKMNVRVKNENIEGTANGNFQFNPSQE